MCLAPTLTTLALLAGAPGGPGSVDGIGPAAHFADPWTFAGDGAGKLYIVDGSIIRAADETTGLVTTLAGTYGPVGGVDGVGPAAGFFQPGGAVYGGGTLYVSDTEDDAIRAVDIATATVTTYAGQIAAPAVQPASRIVASA